MKFRPGIIYSIILSLALLSGCASYQSNVSPTPIQRAQQEIPEDQLMDVAIYTFESEEISEEEAEEKGTSNEIREAEGHYMPYHLKNTLHQSSHWGAVQVIPAETNSMDVFVKGDIKESNGEHLTLEIEVSDATGKRWFIKKYKMEATDSSYHGNRPGEKDAYQHLYNSIANDMAEYKKKLNPDDIKKIRTTAKLKFADDFAPDAFDGYLEKSKKNKARIKRLPADDDPMLARLLKIREREYMYVDTLNEQYDSFYNDMWPSYKNWRQLNLTERKAMREIKRRALTQQLIGALMIAGAIAAGSSDAGGMAAVQTGLILAGTQVIIRGFNVSKEAEIHEAAIQELGESFSSEMKPVVMEFEGRQYELTGSAEEQFTQWRALLRKIYYAETGFDPDPTQNTVESDPDE
ncbi:MAG: hypothetical protein QNL14_16185 [Deltaproteobacteria bacterium]|nr:hypothetical protein [Deltaproteobacteria bacterium]